jgi:hypothetical protein
MPRKDGGTVALPELIAVRAEAPNFPSTRNRCTRARDHLLQSVCREMIWHTQGFSPEARELFVEGCEIGAPLTTVILPNTSAALTKQ